MMVSNITKRKIETWSTIFNVGGCPMSGVRCPVSDFLVSHSVSGVRCPRTSPTGRGGYSVTLIRFIRWPNGKNEVLTDQISDK